MSGYGPASVPAVILAGGLARRMGGGDKPLVAVRGKPMLEHVIERLRPQVSAIAINANGDPARFASYGLPVVEDTVEGFAGPLAGVLAGMRWAERTLPEARFIVSVAGDTPFFPEDLVARLSEGCGRDENTIALAASPAGTHPVFGLWPIRLADELEAFLRTGESGKILAFTDRHVRINVPFDTMDVGGEEIDPFFNVNTPEEAEQADEIARNLQARDPA
ncbi:molybdenum cofactor guanylyltransferase MobA [Propylenella binzhouense]|uniref:Molybdenum cofactor guanylyltransferase n=1 Tax=Propylenella binzhouense TaxID=2555902 RepID=A0A964T9X8_9HYPH|nr:molybdenum cofactor guanylyltransferase MobA [Propylenella binzhouense]MYZ50022.1 molybdenum cofactor guanylyltransferase MobA [Propylenella binzhouense]